MAWWLKAFGVEKLDWRVLDLSFTNLRDPPKQNPSGESEKDFQDAEIRELHIYSSGKQSVLDHWFSEQGIESLKNLERLRVHVVRETCTRQQVQTAFDSIQRGITAIRNRVSEDKKKSLIMTVPGETPWYSTPAVADLTQITQYLSPRLAKLVQDLSGKVENGIRSGEFKRTKVAILDNGILCVPLCCKLLSLCRVRKRTVSTRTRRLLKRPKLHKVNSRPRRRNYRATQSKGPVQTSTAFGLASGMESPL
uniref:Uncharacterized protein n=1 Tax=Bionectria ochroleuca TaxID=29856 RepID=A0A8H7K8S4_BIOOC